MSENIEQGLYQAVDTPPIGEPFDYEDITMYKNCDEAPRFVDIMSM